MGSPPVCGLCLLGIALPEQLRDAPCARPLLSTQRAVRGESPYQRLSYVPHAIAPYLAPHAGLVMARTLWGNPQFTLAFRARVSIARTTVRTHLSPYFSFRDANGTHV